MASSLLMIIILIDIIVMITLTFNVPSTEGKFISSHNHLYYNRCSVKNHMFYNVGFFRD